MSISAEDVVVMLGLSVMILGVIPGMIPGLDFLVAELSEIEIVLESLEDCVGAVDMVRSLKNAISSSEEQFCTDFGEKSVLTGAFFVELLHSLETNASENAGNIYLRLRYYFRERKFLEWEIWRWDWIWIWN